MTNMFRTLTALLALLLTGYVSQAATVYVDLASTGTPDGKSWATAYKELGDAITTAQAGDQIWIAKGEYNTPLNAAGTARVPYILDKSLSFYGGFAGGETALDQRNTAANKTVFSGIDVSKFAIFFSFGSGNFMASFDHVSFEKIDIAIGGSSVYKNISLIFNYVKAENSGTLCSFYAIDTLFVNIDNSFFYNNNSVISQQNIGEATISIRNSEILNCSNSAVRYLSLNNTGKVEFENVIADNMSGAFYEGSGDVSFQKCQISQCSGPVITTNSSKFNSITIDSCDFYKNKNYIVNYSNPNSNLTISNTDFDSNTGSCLISKNYDITSIQNCSFSGNAGYLLFQDCKSVTLTDCKFEKINSNSLLNLISIDTARLKNCTLTNNTIASNFINSPNSGTNLFIENLKSSFNKGDNLIYSSSSNVSVNSCTSVSDTLGNVLLSSSSLTEISIDSLSIYNGVFSNAINSYSAKSCLIKNSEIRKSTCSSSLLGGTINVENTVIADNSAKTINDNSGSSFDNVKVIRNRDLEYIINGGYQTGVLKIRNSEFSGNEFLISGIFTTTSIIVDNSSFRNNKSQRFESRLFQLYGSKSSFTSTIIDRNTSYFLISGTIPLELNHCIFSNNLIKDRMLTMRTSSDQPIYIRNSIFFANSGILIGSIGDGVFYNSICWNNNFNKKDFELNSYYSNKFEYSNLSHSIQGTGNLSVDPQFIDPENGDFRLSCTSPLINMGSNEYVTEGMTDLDGKPRIFAGRVDMGAYEAQVDPAYTGIPQVAFTPSNIAPCRTEEVLFDNTTPGKDNYRFAWDFGDTTARSFELDPSHRYKQSGQRTVSLLATNVCGQSASISQQLDVQPTFAASIFYPTTVHAGAEQMFSTNAACLSLVWEATEGTIISGQGTDTVFVRWNDGSTGAGKLLLKATGCGSEMCNLPLVADVPIFPDTVMIHGTEKVCQNGLETYKASYNSASASSYYSWSVDGGRILGSAEGYGTELIAVQWDDANKDGALMLSVRNEVLDTLTTDTLAIRLRPILAISKDTVGCFAKTEYVSITNYTTAPLEWSVTGANSINPVTKEVSWGSVAGFDTLQVIVQDENAFCNDTALLSVQVYDYPKVLSIEGEQEILVGNPYEYKAVTNVPATISWSFVGANDNNYTKNPTSVTWGNYTSYSLTATAKVGGECASAPLSTTVKKDATFAILGPDTLCYGSTGSFSVTTTATDAVSYTWMLGNEDKGAGSAKEITFTRSGYNFVKIIASRNGKFYNLSKTVFVHASATDLAIRGESTISPDGGTYVYTITNPHKITYDLTIVGDVSHTVVNDILTVNWGTGTQFSITLVGTPAGDSCKGVPVVFTVTKAPDLLSNVTIVSGNQCLNSEASYKLAIDEKVKNLTWKLSGGGVIKSFNPSAGTVDIQWYNKAGDYTLTASYERYGARTKVLNVKLAVPVPVVLDFAKCEGSSAVVTTTETYDDYTWSKSWSRQVISTEAQASADSAGVYSVKVIDSNGCKGKGSFTVTDIALPKISLTASPQNTFEKGDAPQKVTVSMTSDGAYSYIWQKNGEDFAVTGTSFIVNVDPSVVFKDTYSVTASSKECSNSATMIISVEEDECKDPALSFSATVDCEGYTLTNTSALTDKSTWTFDDGTTSSDLQTVKQLFGTKDTYSVKLTRGCRTLEHSVSRPIMAAIESQSVACTLTSNFTFNTHVQTDYTVTDWSWDFGDGTLPVTLTTGTDKISHAFAKAGTYTVKLTIRAKDALGAVCSHSSSRSVQIDPLPQAQFEVVAPDCGQTTYSLKNTSTYVGTSAEYMWNLDNSNSTTLENVSVDYPSAGDHSISMTVTDTKGCTNQTSQIISAKAVPIVENIAVIGQTYLCPGATVTLTAPVSSTGVYIWKRNGVVMSESSKSIIIDSEGSYSVVYATTSCAVTTPAVSISAFAVNIVPKVPSQVCVGDEVVLDHTGALPSDEYYVWLYEDKVIANSRNGKPVIESAGLTDAGKYSMRISHITYGCVETLPAVTMAVNAKPATPTITIDKAAICYGTSVSATHTNPVAGLKTEWLVNNISSGTGATATLSGLTIANTNINLRVTDANNCLSISEPTYVQVSKPISPSFNSKDTMLVCEGSNIDLQSGLSSGDFTFSWNLYDSVLSSTAPSYNIYHLQVADTGIYQVKATATGTGGYTAGCIGTSATVTIRLRPSYDSLHISGPDSMCTGETAILRTNISENIKWNTDETTDMIRVYGAGSFTVEAKHPESGCVTRRVHTVVENPVPDLSFVPEGIYSRCSNYPLGMTGAGYYSDYKWRLDSDIVADNSPLYVRKYGRYTLEATTLAGCSAVSDTMRISPIACYDSCIVTTTQDNVDGCLRNAIECANNKTGKDAIVFMLAGGGPYVFQPQTPLPIITEGVVIDGTPTSPTDSIVIDGSLCGPTAFQFADGVQNAEVVGMKFINFASPLVFGTKTGFCTIEGNDFKGVTNEVINFGVNSNNNMIVGNTISGPGYHAIMMSGAAKSNHFSRNKVDGFNIGVVAITAQASRFEFNTFTNINNIAVLISANSHSVQINSNDIFDAEIAISVNEGCTDTRVENNKLFLSIKGIVLRSSALVKKNGFIDNTTGVEANSQNIDITQNTFTNTTVSSKAIDLQNNANNNMLPAAFTGVRRDGTGIIISGTSLPGARVELFSNSGQPQQALAYIGTAMADTAGKWEMAIAKGKYFSPDSNYYYVNTATLNSNTSELSAPYKIPCFDCICTVTSSEDVGIATLRAAIDSAHAGECFTIEIALAQPTDITLHSKLREIKLPLTIIGQAGTTVVGDGTFDGLTAMSDSVVLRDLDLRNFNTAISANGKKLTSQNTSIADSRTGIIINGDSCSVTGAQISNCVENAAKITGKDNMIGSFAAPCRFNSSGSAVRIIGGTGNSILYCTIDNNDTAIILSGNGNNNKSAPYDLLATHSAGGATITGKGLTGDHIQVFVSGINGTDALRFVAETVITGNTFSIALPAEFSDASKNFFFVLTATDAQGNTSPLSAPVRLGNQDITCPVTTTNDSGNGSMREAIGCVNRAGSLGSKAIVAFDLAGTDNIIEIKTLLDPITNGLGVLIDAEQENVTVKPISKLEYGLRWDVPSVNVRNLGFNGFTYAIDGRSESTSVDSCTISQCNFAVRLLGIGTASISGNSIVTCRNAFSVSGTNMSLNDNKLDRCLNGIVLQSASFASVLRNKLHNTPSGIVVLNNSSDIYIRDNVITDFSRGIRTLNARNVEITGNTIWSQTRSNYIGVYLARSENIKISDNSIGFTEDGTPTLFGKTCIFSRGVKSVLIKNNEFSGGLLSAIICEDKNDIVVSDNIIGSNRERTSPAFTYGGGISIGSGSVERNTIIGATTHAIIVNDSATVADNILLGNTGIGVASGKVGQMRRNTYSNTENEAKALLENYYNWYHSLTKYPAEFRTYRRTATGLLLKGTSLAGDTVEIFHNNGREQQALAFLGAAATDKDGHWELEIPEGEYFNPNAKNYYVNTASNTRITSELSSPYTVGCFSCTCTVTQTRDFTEGSLRAAIDSAHAGVCMNIDFDLQLPASIEFYSPLREITVPLKITGPAHPEYPQITLLGRSTCFNIQAPAVEISNLQFHWSNTAIDMREDDGIFSNIYMSGNVNNPMLISGNGNHVAGGHIYGGSKRGIYITGDDNIIGAIDARTEISRNGGIAVEINGGLRNSVLYTTMRDNPRAIVHSNNGNNAYPAPTELVGVLAAGEASISGKAHAGDRIQVFRSSYYPETALEFVTEDIITTDDFKIQIPQTALASNDNSFFVLTATSSDGSTSVLTQPVKVGDMPMTCPVTNISDSYAGSLREAVKCANRAAAFGSPADIVFDLNGTENTIRLFTELDSITNIYGVNIINTLAAPVGIHVWTPLKYGFAWDVPFVRVKNLEFNGFDTAIDGLAAATEVDSNSFTNCHTAINLHGTGSAWVRSNDIDSCKTGIGITGESALVANNDIQADTAIQLIGSLRPSVTGNTIHNGSMAIVTNPGCTSATISGNTITDMAKDGIQIFGPSCSVKNNSITDVNNIAVYISKAESCIISDNSILMHTKSIDSTNTGIYIEKSGNAQLINNTIGGQGHAGIKVKTSPSLTINRNFIGFEADRIAPLPVLGTGIISDTIAQVYANTISNCQGYGVTIYNASRLTSNTFKNNVKGGIFVYGRYVDIRENIFINDTTSTNSIELARGANNNVTPATVLRYRRTVKGVRVTGITTSRDTVEIFHNNAKAQQALAYIGYAVADDYGNWDFEIAEGKYFSPGRKNYYVNTATHGDCTSELSAPYELACFDCICTVENTNNSGAKSLRAAIDSAHSGECLTINFDLAVPADIKLDSALREITVPLTINGIAGNTEPAIGIVGDKKGSGFIFNSYDINVNNLRIKNWHEGVTILSNETKLSNINARDNLTAIVVKGNKNHLSGLNIDGSTATAENNQTINIFGKDNVIGTKEAPNTIINGLQGSVIIASGARRNSVLYTNMWSAGYPAMNTPSVTADNYHAEPLNLIGFVDDKTKEAYILGTAHAGDRIQAYFCTYKPGEARRFAVEMIATTDEFKLPIPYDLLVVGDNTFFSLTATSSDGETSKLSNPVVVGNYPMECWVRNTNDSGEGSLRDAVDCATQAGMISQRASAVRFDLDPNLKHQIGVKTKGFDIYSTYGVTIDPGKIPVVLANADSAKYAFTSTKGNVTIANLEFTGFDNAISSANRNMSIKNNRFANNRISINLRGSGSSTVSNNIFASADTALVITGSNTYITNNTFGIADSSAIHCAAVLLNTFGAVVGENKFLNIGAAQENIAAVQIMGGSYCTFVKNTVTAFENGYKALEITKLYGANVRNNTFEKYETSIQFATVTGSISSNTFINTTGNAIDVQASKTVSISGNVTKKIKPDAKIINIHYGSADESNSGIKPPTIKYSTVVKGKVKLVGRAQANSRVEFFRSDRNGKDALEYVGSTTANADSNFTFNYAIRYSDTLEALSFLATQTLNSETSETSAAHRVSSMSCIVDNTGDDGNKGTLRYCINRANKDSADVILFRISDPTRIEDSITVGNVKLIQLVADLPVIKVKKLTIDGTSQWPSSEYPVIAIDGQNKYATALAGKSDASLCYHGIEYRNFETPVKIESAEFIEQTYSVYKDYTREAVHIHDSVSGALYVAKNVFDSKQVHIGQRFITNGAIIDSNTFIAGVDTSIVFEAQNIRFTSNTINAAQSATVCGLAIHDVRDSSVFAHNTINRCNTGAFITGCKNTWFVSNKINAVPDTLPVTDTLLKSPQIAYTSNGIAVSQSDSVFISNNEVQYTEHAITASLGYKVQVLKSKITNNKLTGITIDSCYLANVFGNNISYTPVGIHLSLSDSTKIMSNRVYFHEVAGLEIGTTCKNTLVQSNIIGRLAASLAQTSNGTGIIVAGSNSTIGGELYKTNYLVGNLKGGIVVDKGVNNRITYNCIYENDTTDHAPAYKGISLTNSGNTKRPAPLIETYKEQSKNTIFDVSGTGTAGDTIHLYRSNGGYQDARCFVGQTTVNTSGKWNITLDTTKFDEVDTLRRISLLNNQTFTIVATATDAYGNTSEFSNMMYLGTCFVKNTKDNSDDDYPTPNSLRQAAQCANQVTQIGEIRFAVPSYLVDTIGLGKELMHLTNKQGIDIDGRNMTANSKHTFVIADRDHITARTSIVMKTDTIIENGVPRIVNLVDTITIIDSTHLPTLQTLITVAEGAGPVKIANIEINNANTAMALLTQKPIILDSVRVSEVRSRGIQFLPSCKNVTITAATMTSSPRARYLYFGGGSEMVSISHSVFSEARTALYTDSCNGIAFADNRINTCDTAVYVKTSSNVSIKSNQILVGKDRIGIYLHHNPAEVIGNTVSGTGAEYLIAGYQAPNLKLLDNTISGKCPNIVNLYQCNNYTIKGNRISGGDSSAISINGCDGGYAYANTLSNMGVYGFNLKSALNNRLSRNTTTQHVGALPINLYDEQPAIASNSSKPKPEIIKYEIRRVEGDCNDEAFRTGMIICGKSKPKDSVELFISDSAFLSLEKYIGTVCANDTGYWEMRVPRKYYNKNNKAWYHFTATATDATNNTSEAADMFSFPTPTDKYVVRNTLNEGVQSLRSAIMDVNCSDLFTQIQFEIPTTGVPINLTQSLPPIHAYYGVEILGGTQTQFMRKADSTKTFVSDHVIIDGSKIIDGSPIFSQADTCENLLIDSLYIQNTSNAIALTYSGATISYVRFDGITSGTDASNRSTEAIRILNSGGNTISNCTFSNMNKAIVIEGTAAADKTVSCKNNTIDNNLFDRGHEQLYLSGELTKSDIKGNVFSGSTRAISVYDVPFDNYIQDNVFGTESSLVAGDGIYINNSKSIYILRNAFIGTSLQSDQEGVTHAYVKLENGSSSIMINKNTFGANRSGVVDAPSNIRGVDINGTTEANIRNITISENRFCALKQNAITFQWATAVTANDNAIGYESQDKLDNIKTDYSGLKDFLKNGIQATSSSACVLSNNTITNFTGSGIDLSTCSDMQMEYNRVFSANATKINGIDLHINTAEHSNIGIDAPTITSYKVLSPEVIEIFGRSYPNTRITLYRGYGDKSQSFSFIADITTDSEGKWDYFVEAKDFNFDLINNYVAQVTIGNRSSQLSAPYILRPLLCDLTTNKIGLFEDKYTPCPKTDFTLDCQIEDLTYSWVANNGKMGPFHTQSAQLDSSATVTLTITDKFNCTFTETFEVANKPAAQEPQFLLISKPYVDDTIVLIDIAPAQAANYEWHSSENVTIINSGTGSVSSYDNKSYPSGRFVSFKVSQSGNYDIFQTTTLNGCFSERKKTIRAEYKDPNEEEPYSFQTGINSIMVYPSPVMEGKDAWVYIQSVSKQNISMSIVAATGGVVQTFSLEGHLKYVLELDVPSLTTGMYWVKLQVGDNVVSYPFQYIKTSKSGQ